MPTDAKEPLFLVDTSVLLRAGLGDSPAASDWFDDAVRDGALLVGSRWLATEARCVVTSRRLRGLAVDQAGVEGLLDLIAFSPLDDGLAKEAESIEQALRGGDALHLATALRLAADGGVVVVVTHDVQMAEAAKSLGLSVFDPINDDPNRPSLT